MFTHNGRVSVRQVEIFLILQMLNTTILFLPKIAGDYVGRNGYILPLLAIILGIIYIFCIEGITKQFPRDTLVEFLPKIVPKFIAYIIIILFVIKIAIITGLEARMLGEMISQVLLPKTPVQLIILVMLLTVAYLAKSGIEAIGRMGEVLIYFIAVPLILVFLLVVPHGEYMQLMPFFQTNLREIGVGTFVVSLIFMPLEIMLMLAGLMKETKKVRRAMLVAVITIGIASAIIVLLTYVGVGFNETQRQVWPVLTLMQSMSLNGSMVENQEILMMTGWIFSIFIYLSSGIYFTSLIGSRSFKYKRENIFVLPIVPIIYFIAMVPENLVVAYDYYNKFQYYFGIWFILPIPLILALIAKGRRNSHAE